LPSCILEKNSFPSINYATQTTSEDSNNYRNISLFVSFDSCNEAKGPTPQNGYDPNSSKPTLELKKSIGGGVTNSNEFIIEILLSCETNYLDNWHSDIKGLGIYHSWIYMGNHEEGNIDTYIGFAKNIKWRNGTIGKVDSGFVMPGDWAGINLENNFPLQGTESFDIYFTLFVESPSGKLGGAVLSFNNKLSADGVRPNNIKLRGLTNEELDNLDKSYTYR